MPPSLVMASMAFCTSGNPTFPAVTSSPTLSLVTPNCLASSSAKGIPLPWNWRRSCVNSLPCVIVVPYNQTRSFKGMERPAAISPRRISVAFTSLASVPYASNCFAPLATPCKSKGVLAAVLTNCDISSLDCLSLPSIVLKATSNCWNSPLTRVMSLTSCFAPRLTPNAAAAVVIRLNRCSISIPLSSICLDVLRTPFLDSSSF